MKHRERIIVALDIDSESKALEWARTLGPRCGAVKVGMQLYAAAGPQIVGKIRDAGCEVFLDLKLHDIPTTVAKAAQALLPLEPLMLNLHALGGRKMLADTAAAVRSTCEKTRLRKPLLLAVTILTSHDSVSLAEVDLRAPIAEQVRRLSSLAYSEGLDGVVASAHEVAIVKEACGVHFKVVTPGIRPATASVDDQVRAMTPAAAVAAGVDYMVIGRPITGAADPLAALEAIVREIESA